MTTEVGEYAFGEPDGIRSRPYTNYPRTYSSFAGTEVHLDGEIYGAIGWRLGELFRESGLTTEELLDYVVDGMNYTPANPKFEQMRDGILAAVGGRRLAATWCGGLREGGVGVGATSKTTGSGITVTESFVPGVCH